ncbi:MAG: hypothetical protein RL398_1823 [Planctomycetota bacterium]|jgi:predicted nucleic acid-binding protein
MRIFLDANVLFSAANQGSHIARLVREVLVEQVGESVRMLTSDLAIVEAERNLRRKRPDWLPRFEDLLTNLEVVPTSSFPLPVELQAQDRPLLCAAIRARCSHFVTGDRRDFGHLFGQRVEGVLVVDLLTLAKLLTRL